MESTDSQHDLLSNVLLGIPRIRFKTEKKQYFEIKRKETRGELGITTTITMRLIIQPMPKNEG